MDEIKELSVREHMRKRGMLAGSKSVEEFTLPLISADGSINEESVTVTPLFMKMFDEIIVNCIDQYTLSKKVTKIRVRFNGASIVVYNDGTCFPVKVIETSQGPMNSIAAALAINMTGSNFGDNDRVTGGQNGVGMKVVTHHCHYVQVDTVHPDKTRYTQRIEDDPVADTLVICDLATSKMSREVSTQIAYAPIYELINATDEMIPSFDKMIRTRLYQTSAFTGCDIKYFSQIRSVDVRSVDVRSVDVRSVDQQSVDQQSVDQRREDISVDFKSLCKLYTGTENVMHIHVPNIKNPEMSWTVYLAGSDGHKSFTLMNGIDIPEGTHVDYILEKLRDAYREVTGNASLSVKSIKPYLYICIKGYIANIEFDSQVKTKVTNSKSKFKDRYVIPIEVAKSSFEIVREMYELSQNRKIAKQIKSGSKKQILEVSNKVYDAELAGTPSAMNKTKLVIGEGDSAIQLVEYALSPTTNFSRRYIGTVNTQGVPVSTGKSKDTLLDVDDEQIWKISEKIQNNVFFKRLIMLLGLQLNCRYETEKEFRKLRYGQVIIAVDQDFDGKGKIFGLILCIFAKYWPALIQRPGYIVRLNTPIVRIAKKKLCSSKDVLTEFYTMGEFHAWMSTNKMRNGFEPKYYKGLAGHPGTLAPAMFSDLPRKCIEFIFDDDAVEYIDIYYGKDADKRKDILSEVKELDTYDPSRPVPISLVLNTDIREYQLDSLKRVIMHAVDGLVQSQRKILYTAKACLKEDTKVPEFSGEVMKRSDYAHGNMSIDAVIINMTRSCVGTNIIPLLLATSGRVISQRKFRGKVCASARYIMVNMNQLTNKLYPADDDYLLEYRLDEGSRYEPNYYVPIIPMPIMIPRDQPAHGWRCTVWPREYDDVYNNLLARLEDGRPFSHLPIFLSNTSCKKVFVRNDMYIVGRYEIAGNVLAITDLSPWYTKTNADYITDMIKQHPGLIISHCDLSSYDPVTNIDAIRIEFTMAEGAINEIYSDPRYAKEPFDPIEIAFKLYSKTNSLNMNMMGTNLEVIHFHHYHSIMEYWFNIRKELYERRILRKIAVLRVYIDVKRNVYRFIVEMRSKIKLGEMDEEEIYDLLDANGFTRYNWPNVQNPGYKTIEEYLSSVHDDASYDYILGGKLTDYLYKKSADKVLEDIKKKEQELAELEDDVGVFTGRKTWIKELKAVDAIIRKGLKHGWEHI
jgi:DNA topoisomerase-2